MIGHVMYDLGLDPTVIVGSLLKEWNGNFLPGTSEYFVVEGCEYRRSFLNLHPHVLIITNIEVDHLDYYKDIEDIKSAFKELALRVPTDGMIIADMENEHVISVLEDIAAPIVNYKNFDLDGIKLKVPGRYNLENAKAAFATVQSLDGGEGKIKKSLETFAGAWRRFEYKGQLSNGAVVYDDYAHHPTEIQSFLTAVREHFSDKKILAIFQPHLHSRTEDFLEGFAASLAIADEIIILPIFEAREEISHNVSAEDLVEKIRSLGKDAKAMDFEKVSEVVKSKDNNWFIATIGAGKTNTLAEALVKNI
jgi:UDP-N-acetylmuramate--alanine ligase